MKVRLGPIYDALESCDYKNTLRLIRNAEQRYGNDAILYALKALALCRSDRIEEAHEACRSFLECRSVEPAILETALVVFKELGRLDWNREAYENAVEICPNEEDLLTGLYFAYLREWSYLKQQQTAMRLFKLFKAEKYLRWASVCIELQNGALETSALMAQGDDIPQVEAGFGRLLQLASMVLEKDSDPEVMSSKCLSQYLRVLRRLGRHEIIVKVLQARLDSDPDLQFLLAKSLNALEMYNQASAILKNLMETRNADDWRYLKIFVEAQVAFNSQFEGSNAIAILRSLRRVGKRGPWIGELYATCLMRLQSDHHVREYFEKFGHKRSFFADVESYLSHVGNVEMLLQAMEVSSDDFSEDNIRRRISYEMCWRALRCHERCSNAELASKAQSLFDAFQASVNPNKEKTEFGIGDELCMLCAYTLIDIYDRDGNRSHLLQAVTVLTVGLQSSPHNFQFLLLLIRLYAQLGAFLGAFEHYAALDTKSIQLETLTHLVQNDALRYGMISHAVALASAVVSHQDQYERDAPDLIILCYSKDNLDQTVEFTQFHERLRRSFRLAESRRILEFFTRYLDQPVSCTAMQMQFKADLDPKQLIINDDYLLLLHPEKERGPVLSRSSSFLHETSWHPESQESRVATLQFLRTSLCLTDALARADAPVIYSHLASLRQQLSIIGVVCLDAPVTANDCFAKQHWRFCVIIFSCAASLSKCWEDSSKMIEGRTAVDSGRLRDHWSEFQRQLKILEISTQQVLQTLLELIDSTPNHGAASVAMFLYFAARWSVLLVDVCAARLPVKRSLYNKFCQKMQNRNSELEEDIWHMLSASLNMLLSLKICFQTQFESLRDKLTAARDAPDGIHGFGDFSIKQLSTNHEVAKTVSLLLSKSRTATCEHALDSLQRCLNSLAETKVFKV